MASHANAARLELLVHDVRDDFFGQIGLQIVGPVGQHFVPKLGIIPGALHLGLHFHGPGMKVSAYLGRGLVGVDLHGCGSQFVEPAAKTVARMPWGHHGDCAGRQLADALQRVELVEHDDLALHARRANLVHEQLGIDLLAIENQIDPTLGQRKALGKREDSAPANRRANQEPKSMCFSSSSVWSRISPVPLDLSFS